MSTNPITDLSRDLQASANATADPDAHTQLLRAAEAIGALGDLLAETERGGVMEADPVRAHLLSAVSQDG